MVEDDTKPGFAGMMVVRIHLFFSFTFEEKHYPCALVEWFVKWGQHPDQATGMWKVEHDERRNGERVFSVIHLDTILRAAHLIPDFGARPVPLNFDHRYSLDCFDMFYVNKYADHHSHQCIQ